MKKILNIIISILLIIWQLPQTLVGLIMLPFLGSIKKIEHRNHCIGFCGEKMRGGISLGCIAIVSRSSSRYPETIAHEMDGHTVDSKIFGPLYLLVIGIPSLLWAWLRDTTKHPNYYAFYTERWANRHAGLEVYSFTRGSKTYYDIKFKDEK